MSHTHTHTNTHTHTHTHTVSLCYPQFSRLSERPETVCTFDMAKLHTHLLEKAASTPAAAYHNLLVLKYEVSHSWLTRQWQHILSRSK